MYLITKNGVTVRSVPKRYLRDRDLEAILSAGFTVTYTTTTGE